MILLFSLWLVLSVVVAAMALYRNYVSRNEDDVLHLSPGTDGVIKEQVSLAGKLSVIDRWGKTLTVIDVAFGMVLATYWLYQSWLESAKLH